jgi:hypothetical protein
MIARIWTREIWVLNNMRLSMSFATFLIVYYAGVIVRIASADFNLYMNESETKRLLGN